MRVGDAVGDADLLVRAAALDDVGRGRSGRIVKSSWTANTIDSCARGAQRPGLGAGADLERLGGGRAEAHPQRRPRGGGAVQLDAEQVEQRDVELVGDPPRRSIASPVIHANSSISVMPGRGRR